MLLIEVGEHDIYEGNYWTNRCAKAVDYFLDGRDDYPEAIICANDYMALSICEELKKRGKRVPEDVCVAGFDGITISIASIDKDNLKLINDIYGHADGDFALKTLSGILKTCLNQDEVCARFGGDEFSAVLISHQQGRVEEFMDIFGKRLSGVSRSSGKPYPIHASVGICDLKGGDTKHIFACMQMADERMYINKRNYKKSQR